MSLFERFRKDYFNYLASIILPALITAVTIPVLKTLLGAADYGAFSLHYNGALIFSTITTGWITQSISRFYPISDNKPLFARKALRLTVIFQWILIAVTIPVLYFFEKDILLTLLIGLNFFVCAIQFSFMVIAQSNFLSRKTIYSETIRTLSYFLVALALLRLTGLHYLHALFIAAILSFAFSVLYLYMKTKSFFIADQSVVTNNSDEPSMIKRFFRYGTPLSLWFVFAYFLTYIDKIFMREYLGAVVQGNYQALFDMLSRGFTLVISPVLLTLLPLLTVAYQEGKKAEINALLKKIILFEWLGFMLVTVAYYGFGASLLMKILHVPDSSTYRHMGFIIIAGTFIWQMAMVINKTYELELKSIKMLYAVIIAFGCQVLYFKWVGHTRNELLIAFGYPLSSLAYLLMITYGFLLRRMKRKQL